jgi:NPCBM-associated, NEW3 domain of alpha-galactosidase
MRSRRVCIRVRSLIAPLTVLLIVAATLSAFAHGPSSPPGQTVAQAARALNEQLTLDVVRLNVKYQLSIGGQKAGLERDLLAAVINREQQLLALMDSDPGEVLRVTIPSSIRASLPSGVKPHVEEETDIEGVFEILHEDDVNGGRYHYGLETAIGKLSLHFASDPPTHLLTGARVRVQGVRLGQTLAVGSGNTSLQTVSAAAVVPNTFGAQKTVVILVNFADKATQPFTIDYARSVVFTTTSNFDLENSYNQTWLTGDVVGWYTIPLSSTVCDYSTLATQAKQAATSGGVNLSTYSRYVYAFPKNACGWSGVGTVGGNPSQAWVNGSLELWVVGHEMGHNLGLYHSHGYNCSSGAVPGGCTVQEYGDTFDIMGHSRSNHFNSFQKERLGWLNYGASPAITTATTNGTYTIDRYETPGGVKALKLLQGTDPVTGKKTYYYLEYRQPIGFDASVSGYPSVLNGVVARTASESSANSSYLLDLTPPPYPAVYAPGLVLGQGYTDSTAGITITPVWADGTRAGVNVAFSAQQCVQAIPAIAISPSQSQWASAGTTLTYTVSVTNYDSLACPSSSFTIQAGAPADWSAALGTAALNVAPGASGSATLSVTSAPTAANGYYTIDLSATDLADAARSAAASATYMVAPSLDVRVSTDSSSYRTNQTVTITTVVSVSSVPVAGASVTVTVARPDGSTTNLSATTDTIGRAIVKYRSKRQDPTGIYQVRSTATQSNTGSGWATTSFVVQ